MDKNSNPLILLRIAAGIAVLAGILLSIHSLSGLGRIREILDKKSGDSRELAGLRTTALRHQVILDAYAQYPAAPVRLETLVNSAIPAQSLRILSNGATRSMPGWTFRSVSLEFTDIAGADLGRFLDAGATARPPWALLECTLFAGTVPGRVSKATLVMESVERQQ